MEYSNSLQCKCLELPGKGSSAQSALELLHCNYAKQVVVVEATSQFPFPILVPFAALLCSDTVRRHSMAMAMALPKNYYREGDVMWPGNDNSGGDGEGKDVVSPATILAKQSGGRKCQELNR